MNEDTMAVAARVAEHVLMRLGKSDASVVERVASEVLAALDPGTQSSAAPGAAACRRLLLGVYRIGTQSSSPQSGDYVDGAKPKGVVAKLTAILAELGGDILDISQTLVGDYFTMLVIVDIAEMRVDFSQLKTQLQQVADAMGIHVMLMHEDLVRSLHRV